MPNTLLAHVQCPSNIALIKYMGKIGKDSNQPTNPSLSYTLDHLLTTVEIHESGNDHDTWEPLKGEDLVPLELSEVGREKFLRHFARCKSELGVSGNFLIKSANNFPSDCGIASSASSFAALTRAVALLASDRGDRPEVVEALRDEDLAALSRLGSGSSCRSFFSPWALWTADRVEGLKLPWSFLLHQVVLLERGRKQVSSSEAHSRVATSDLFQGRPERALKRLSRLLEAMNAQDWKKSYELIHAEFWDMHTLFTTSHPSFRYMTSGSMKVIEMVEEIWQQNNDGPWITMDAGANVHLLYRPDQRELAVWFQQEMESWTKIISSPHIKESWVSRT